MAIEFFRLSRGRGMMYSGCVKITKKGSITIPKQIMNKYGLHAHKLVLLGYDEKAKIIVIKFITEYEEGALILKRTGIAKTASINANYFFEYSELNYLRDSILPVTVTNDMLIVDISSEKEDNK